MVQQAQCISLQTQGNLVEMDYSPRVQPWQKSSMRTFLFRGGQGDCGGQCVQAGQGGWDGGSGQKLSENV